jgi:hypothetical protein
MSTGRIGKLSTAESRRAILVTVIVIVTVALGYCVIQLSGKAIGDPSRLLITLVWGALISIAVVLFEEPVRIFLGNVANAERIEFKGVVIQGAPRIPVPAADEAVTIANIALLHTSFARADKTKEINDGLTYFQIEVAILAPAAVLDRIEKVTYHLDPSYPRQSYEVADRSSRFKLKELANGASIIWAEIKFQGESKALQINRFIDLHASGPRI